MNIISKDLDVTFKFREQHSYICAGRNLRNGSVMLKNFSVMHYGLRRLPNERRNLCNAFGENDPHGKHCSGKTPPRENTQK